jgi:integrase
VRIPPHIRADIQTHLDTFVDSDPESLLFVPVRGGCHVSDRVVRDAFRDACVPADVHGMRLHDLRHFAGTMTARVGNLPETMARLGHSTQSASLPIRARCRAVPWRSPKRCRHWRRARSKRSSLRWVGAGIETTAGAGGGRLSVVGSPCFSVVSEGHACKRRVGRVAIRRRGA